MDAGVLSPGGLLFSLHFISRVVSTLGPYVIYEHKTGHRPRVGSMHEALSV